MYNIRTYAKETGLAFPDYYKQILQNNIEKVFCAINECDEDITWFICKDKDLPDNNEKCLTAFGKKLIISNESQYGRCCISEKKIWISTDAIVTASDYYNNKYGILNNPVVKSLNNEETYTRLIDVIIDEFTHIKTKKDHGNREYDECRERYRNMYKEKYCISNNERVSVLLDILIPNPMCKKTLDKK